MQRLLRRQFLAVAEAGGFQLTPEQFFVLDKLTRKDGQSQTELADDELQDRPNLTRMIRELEGRGLVVRRADSSDARKKRVYLTQDGTQLYETFFAEVVVPTRAAMFDDLPPADLAATHAVFDRLEQSLC
ncbi:MAG: MarR family winged helix-turn-helix transcriptional regulator [Myxococcota bacterium]